MTLRGEVHEVLAAAALLGKENPPIEKLSLENVEDGQ
jgi:hypothetical protein